MLIRIIFAVLGYQVTGSFLGGILGWLLGGVINNLLFRRRVTTFSRTYTRTNYMSQDQFIHSLLIFISAVVKSDNNNLLKSELDYVKSYLLRTFGPEKTQNALLELREILNNGNINLDHECSAFRNSANINEKLVIIQFLFGLASSDGEASQAEFNTIKTISTKIGIGVNEYEAIKAMYFGRYQTYNSGQRGYGYGGYSGSQQTYKPSYNLENDYKILEIDSSATDDEVKKAYRKQAMKHHPDKVSHLGEVIRKAAEEKFQKLNEAYERIKSARGIK